jgi:hypothetical protein
MLFPSAARLWLPRLTETTRLFSVTTASPLLEFNYCVGLEDSDYNQVIYSDNIPSAISARHELEELLGNPREPNEKRFQWDPWFVRCEQGRQGKDAPLPGDFMDWNAIPGES